MEETPQASASAPQQAMKKEKYSVSKLYRSAWELAKKNTKLFATISLIGVAFEVLVSIVMAATIYNAFVDSESSRIVQLVITAIGSIAGAIILSLIQIVAIKSVTEGKSLGLEAIMKRAFKLLPRFVLYGLFILGVYIAAAVLIVVAAGISGGLAAFMALALVIALFVALFKYAFVQYIIIEDKELGFFERFRISERLTKGLTGTILLMILMAGVLGIGTGIVTGILTSPFKDNTASTSSTDFSLNLNDDNDLESFRDSVQKSIDEAGDVKVDANYVIRTVIESAISAGLSLIILAAFLELYKYRKMDEKLEL